MSQVSWGVLKWTVTFKSPIIVCLNIFQLKCDYMVVAVTVLRATKCVTTSGSISFIQANEGKAGVSTDTMKSDPDSKTKGENFTWSSWLLDQMII